IHRGARGKVRQHGWKSHRLPAQVEDELKDAIAVPHHPESGFVFADGPATEATKYSSASIVLKRRGHRFDACLCFSRRARARTHETLLGEHNSQASGPAPRSVPWLFSLTCLPCDLMLACHN